MDRLSWDPDGEAVAALGAVVGQFGPEVLGDDALMKSGLSDSLPGDSLKRERGLLEEACKLGVADDIKGHIARGMDVDSAVQLTARNLSESKPLDPSGCVWVARQFRAHSGVPGERSTQW